MLCSFLSFGAEITCDSEECFDLDPCCLITKTAINASNLTIFGLEDESVRLFDSSRNQNVEFLPIHISNKFPNLVSYDANRCAIKEISQTNFGNLFHLKMLNLVGNRLRTIVSNTFEDLVSLESLLLGKYSSLLFFRVKTSEHEAIKRFFFQPGTKSKPWKADYFVSCKELRL